MPSPSFFSALLFVHMFTYISWYFIMFWRGEFFDTYKGLQDIVLNL